MNLETINRVMRDIEFGDWRFFVRTLPEGWLFYLRFVAADLTRQSTRKWYISPYATESELVQTVFKAVLTACEHEVRESFFYRGKAIFGPHFDVNALVDSMPPLELRDPDPILADMYDAQEARNDIAKGDVPEGDRHEAPEGWVDGDEKLPL